MEKEILVFIFNGYADWEGAYICSELNNSKDKYTIKTLSFDYEPKISMGGFRVIPDYDFNDCPKEFEMLILLGGESWIEKKNDGIEPIVRYAINKKIIVSAICGATLFIGEKGYLNNIKHTSNTMEYLKMHSANYKGEKLYMEKQAVYDKKIITANGTATLEFAKEIMLQLKVKSKLEIEQWYNFHKNGSCQL